MYCASKDVPDMICFGHSLASRLQKVCRHQ